MLNRFIFGLVAILILLVGLLGSAAQGLMGSIHGTVADPSGAVVPSATITLTDQGGISASVVSDGDGSFVINNLEPGSYTISVTVDGFAPFDPLAVRVAAGKSMLQNIALKLPAETQNVTVSDEGMSVDTSADNNASSLVIKGKDLDALSDDPR